MNKELINYIENSIIPKYSEFDKGHGIDHVRSVIDESLKLAVNCNVNLDYAYVIAAYHDLGLCEGRELHHIVSGKILEADKHLQQWFSGDAIKLMKEAVEDHRASAKNSPRIFTVKLLPKLIVILFL